MSDFRAGSNLVSATFQTLSFFRRLPPSDHFVLTSGRAVHGVGDGVMEGVSRDRWGGKGSGVEGGLDAS